DHRHRMPPPHGRRVGGASPAHGPPVGSERSRAAAPADGVSPVLGIRRGPGPGPGPPGRLLRFGTGAASRHPDGGSQSPPPRMKSRFLAILAVTAVLFTGAPAVAVPLQVPVPPREGLVSPAAPDVSAETWIVYDADA